MNLWPRGLHRQAGSHRPLMTPGPRIPVTPQERYTRAVRAPIGNSGIQYGTINATGKLTLKAGPAGVGNTWYPSMAVISTSTGADDTATCQVYIGNSGVATLPGGTSYAGGGDSVGLPGVGIGPGEFVIAEWAGATAGDTATLRVIGDQDALT